MELRSLQELAIRRTKLDKETLIEGIKKEVFDSLFVEGELKEKYLFDLVENGIIEFSYFFNEGLEGYEKLHKIFGEEELKKRIPGMVEEATKLIFPIDKVEVKEEENKKDTFLIAISE